VASFSLASQRKAYWYQDFFSVLPFSMFLMEKAIVVYTRGSRFLEGTPIPPSRFDHQATYLDFWLRLVGVRDLRSVVVDNAWNRDRRESEVSLAKGKASLERLVEWFLASSELQQRAMPLT
jgi:Flavodoxin-like fold